VNRLVAHPIRGVDVGAEVEQRADEVRAVGSGGEVQRGVAGVDVAGDGGEEEALGALARSAGAETRRGKLWRCGEEPKRIAGCVVRDDRFDEAA
jgi:hypothetical protein